jgi:hypothetical protein
MSFFNFLKKPNNPALPLPTPEYSRTFLDNHNNVLRLFFNQLTNVFDNILGPNGGQFIDCPNGLFFNTQEQIYAANDTAYPVEFDSTYLSNGVALEAVTVTAGSFVVGVRYTIVSVGSTNFTLIGAASNTVGVVFVATGVGAGTGTASTKSRIRVSVNGVYNFQYTGQVYTLTGSKVEVALWIARNGTDVSYSTRINTIQSNNHYFEVNWNFDIDLAAGEYIEMRTSIDDHAPNIKLAAFAATSPYPAGASSVLTVNFIAPLPDPRPTLPP